MSFQLSAETKILNTLGLFARVVDRKDWLRIKEVFVEDVRFNYGDGCERQGLEALAETFSTFLNRCGPTQHLLGSIQFEWDGENAITRAYVQARHQGKENPSLYFDSNGEYVDRWENRDGNWRIVRRDVQWLTFSGDPSVLQI